MFVGHYGVAFAIKAARPATPLWLLFVAVQLVDIAWAILVLLGIEKLRIVPGITASNPLDLFYMPYTHSLTAAALWTGAATVLCKPLPGVRTWPGAAWVGLAVLSHWGLDWLVHRPDLPLYGDAMKVGLGLWNHPAIALLLEAFLLFGAILVYMQRTTAVDVIGRFGPLVLGIVMLVIQCYVFFGPPPSSPNAAALTALAAYAVFAALVIGIDRRRHSISGQPSGARE